MAQVMAFPREFEKNFWRDLDREFAGIVLGTALFALICVLWGASQPVRVITLEEAKKYTETIYRVKAAAPAQKVVQKTEAKQIVQSEAPKEDERQAKREARRQELESSSGGGGGGGGGAVVGGRAEKTASARAERAERQEARRAGISERVKILGGPTAKGGRRRGGAAAARDVIGLSGTDQGVGGGSASLDIKQLTGMIGEAGTAEKVKKLRSGGVVGAGVGEGPGGGGINISELKAMSSSDIDLMLNEAPIQLSRSAITAKGSGTKAKQRSQSAISDIVLQNKNQVQYCYWTLKRKDSGLKGKVVVEFTIATSGEVIRVRFRESNWGGNALGADCENCINNVISSWRFDKIGDSEGNVTAGATYIFE